MALTDKEFEDILVQTLQEVMESNEESPITSVVRFEDAGVLTYNKGVEVLVDDDCLFQVSIVRAR